MMKAIIIDDEKKSRELLNTMITENLSDDVIVTGMAENILTANDLLTRFKPQLVFLDIELGGESGFDFLEALPSIHFEVIFTTAFNQYAIKAFKYSAIDYLLKPVDPDELKLAVDRVKKKTETLNSFSNLKQLIDNLGKSDEYQQKITLPTGNAFEIINIKDIIRCEADGNYTHFVLSDKRKIMVSNGLKYYEDLLPSEHFIRIHHHHLINMNHVQRYLKVDGGYAIMSDDSKIELSRRKKDLFLQKLNNP